MGHISFMCMIAMLVWKKLEYYKVKYMSIISG